MAINTDVNGEYAERHLSDGDSSIHNNSGHAERGGGNN